MRCLTASFSLQAQADTVHFLSPGVDGDERADERLGPGAALGELKVVRGVQKLSWELARRLWLAPHPSPCQDIDQASAKKGRRQTRW